VILGRCIRDIVVVTMKMGEAKKIESEGVTGDPSSVLGAKWTRTGYGVPSRQPWVQLWHRHVFEQRATVQVSDGLFS